MGDSSKDNRNAAKQTTIEAGTTFKGSLGSDCPIVVRGRVEGELTGPSLTVSSTGSVSGTVRVEELRSDGELSGEYHADHVELSGTVRDNTVIRAKSLEVKLASESKRMEIVFGECELEVGDVPDEAEAVAEATASNVMSVARADEAADGQAGDDAAPGGNGAAEAAASEGDGSAEAAKPEGDGSTEAASAQADSPTTDSQGEGDGEAAKPNGGKRRKSTLPPAL